MVRNAGRSVQSFSLVAALLVTAIAAGQSTVLNGELAIPALDTPGPTPATRSVAATDTDAGRSDNAAPETDARSHESASVALSTSSRLERRPLGAPPSSPVAVDAGETSSSTRRLGWQMNELVRVCGALIAVIGIMLLIRLFLARAGLATSRAVRPSGVVEVLGRFPVARGQTLLLLKFARRVILVQQNGQTMTTLSEVTDQNEVAALIARVEAGTSGASSAKFRSMLRHFEQAHDGVPDMEPGDVIDLTRSRRSRGRRTG